MNVPLIPAELVDAILSEVEDIESLKACSLAGSALRHPICTFLEESHVAPYITRFTIYLPAHTVPQESFTQVLRLLPNVRRCILSGDSQARDGRKAYLPFPVLDFLARQPLRDLHVMNITDLPLTWFCHLLGFAPTVYFYEVFISEESQRSLSGYSAPCLCSNTIEARTRFLWHMGGAGSSSVRILYNGLAALGNHCKIRGL
ncbi:hypothetical protein B0H19DRAFT_128228 [Mycena capillaripes]|nr:hypothetical protein B0H19DRAFT_128228 [Mycena capillaripes]